MDLTKEKIIRRSNELALRAEGRTGTNPMVGALLIRSGKIIEEDWHHSFGGPHAEINVIQKAKDHTDFKHSELAVSLEPCNHQGKTPACTDSILKHQIPALLIDQIDPNSQMSGKSLDDLKQQKISVTGPLSTKTGARVLAPFYINTTQNRPYIVIKIAVSRDGYIGRPGGQIKISHPISDRWVHKIRSRLQGIMVGTNTISNDNPSLIARYHHQHNPIRIIPDRKGILDEDLRIFHLEDDQNIIFTTSDRSYSNARVIRMKDMSLPRLFRKLYDLNIGSLLIEGGSQLIRSVVKAELWDEWIQIQSKTISLGQGIPAPPLPSLTPYFEKTLGTDNWKIIKTPALR